MDWDLGDIVASFNLRVKGRQRRGIVLRAGVHEPTTPEERSQPRGHASPRPPTRLEFRLMTDLAADHKRPYSVTWTDEVGNPTGAPFNSSVAFTSSDTAILNVVDNGDGTAEALATGVLGQASVLVTASADGESFEGEDVVNVVAGLAERINVVAGESVEITPDDV